MTLVRVGVRLACASILILAGVAKLMDIGSATSSLVHVGAAVGELALGVLLASGLAPRLSAVALLLLSAVFVAWHVLAGPPVGGGGCGCMGVLEVEYHQQFLVSGVLLALAGSNCLSNFSPAAQKLRATDRILHEAREG